MDAQSGVNFVLSAGIKWVFVFFVSAWREESCLAGSRREETKLSLREVKHHKFNFKVCEGFFLSSSFLCPLFAFRIFSLILFMMVFVVVIIVIYPTVC